MVVARPTRMLYVEDVPRQHLSQLAKQSIDQSAPAPHAQSLGGKGRGGPPDEEVVVSVRLEDTRSLDTVGVGRKRVDRSTASQASTSDETE